MNLMDDDSENDSDYVPEEDPDFVPNEVEEKGEEIKSITFGRKKKAQELWDELQREDQQYMKSHLSKSISFNSSYFSVEVPTNKIVRKLKSYFGLKKTKQKKGSAAPSSSSSSKKRPREEEESTGNPVEQSIEGDGSNKANETEIRQRAMEAISQIKKKSKVEEVRRFAGQSIVIEKTVLQSAEEKTEEEKRKSRQSAIDKALEALKGPKAVSTVQKSAVDWDNFKEKEGIADEVSQAAAKNAYLQKKDFLERCDYRSFEKERDERLREIAKR